MQISKDFAPPFKMIEPFFKFGSLFYILSLGLLLFINPSSLIDFKVVGFAHLFLLGFVMMIIFGAMAQLIPVALEIGHFSVDLFYAIFYTLLFGIIFLVSGFFFSNILIPYGATLVFVSMSLFLFETLMTLKKTQTSNITVDSVKYGNYFLMAAIIIGFIMAAVIGNNLAIDISNLLPIHVVFVVFGYVTITIIGMSMVLLPMFGLAHGYEDKDVKLSFKILIFATLGFGLFKLFNLNFLANITLIAIIVAVFLYLKQLLILYKIRARRLLDIWYKYIYVAFISMPIAIILGLIGFYFNLDNFFKVGVWVYLIGFFAFVINAHLLKIIPFLVWFERFSPLVGKKKVPMLHEMLDDKDNDYSFYLSLIGLIVSSIGLILNNNDIFKGGILLLFLGAFFMYKAIKYILDFKEEDYV